MVLKVKDFTWSQNDESIFINIPLKGKKKSETDIITTDSYIKVNFTPYIFECFLSEHIDDLNSKVIFLDGMLMFSLKKVKLVSWPSLHNVIYDDRVTANEKRLLEIEKFESKTNKIEKENSDQKCEGNKYSLREMMQLESEEKDRIKSYKERETKQAMDDLEEWKKSQVTPTPRQTLTIQEIHDNDDEEVVKVLKPVTKLKKTPEIPRESSQFSEPIRKPCKIEVSFTPRVFPTPERESVKEQEDEWLKKQLDVKLQNKVKVTADMKPEENNPEWLKSKGNSFFAAGDFGGALAAYSLGLEINPDLFELYSNRAACHIKMRNFFKAVEDSSKALELLNPPVNQNLKSRVKAHLRRGAAYCNLEMYREGLLDYELALKLDPDNESIRMDVARLKEM